ncbi:MAG TPA: Rieske 2Fe-2S domain-containing protein [Terracidiphilus sp.]|nr:Rieske 2Fe-2S domain-containing protein [Terracidiphilus sp.]
MNSPGDHGQPAPAPQPQAPAAAHNQKSDMHSRRAFLFKISLLLNGAVGLVLAVPIFGYLFGPAFKKGSSYKSWISLGPITDFPEGETRLADFRNPVTSPSDGATANVACWVRHIQANQFQVFAINCAHLNCPVRWFPQSHLFMCPCHGGVYYEDGSRASGPPPRGLFEYNYSISGNNLMIDAGQMPTLSNQACNQKPVVQIESLPATASESNPDARSTSWPA